MTFSDLNFIFKEKRASSLLTNEGKFLWDLTAKISSNEKEKDRDLYVKQTFAHTPASLIGSPVGSKVRRMGTIPGSDCDYHTQTSTRTRNSGTAVSLGAPRHLRNGPADPAHTD